VLACAEGSENKEVAAGLHVDQGTVGKWRRRFVERRIDGLRDEPRSGTPRTIDDARIEGVVVKTLESLPADATHWSSRGMAKASGISVSSGSITYAGQELPQGDWMFIPKNTRYSFEVGSLGAVLCYCYCCCCVPKATR